MKIARHFSAGNSDHDDESPGRTAETLAVQVSAVLPGLMKNTWWSLVPAGPGTEVPGYYRAAPDGALTAFIPCCEVES